MLVLNASLVPAELSKGMPQEVKTSNTNLIVARVVRAIEFILYTKVRILPIKPLVAHWVEQQTHNLSVAGSNPAQN